MLSSQVPLQSLSAPSHTSAAPGLTSASKSSQSAVSTLTHAVPPSTILVAQPVKVSPSPSWPSSHWASQLLSIPSHCSSAAGDTRSSRSLQSPSQVVTRSPSSLTFSSACWSQSSSMSLPQVSLAAGLMSGSTSLQSSSVQPSQSWSRGRPMVTLSPASVTQVTQPVSVEPNPAGSSAPSTTGHMATSPLTKPTGWSSAPKPTTSPPLYAMTATITSASGCSRGRMSRRYGSSARSRPSSRMSASGLGSTKRVGSSGITPSMPT